MARHDKQERRVLADERIIHGIREFFSQHATKLVLIVIVALAVFVVWMVSIHTGRAKEKEVGDYLEKNLYTRLEMAQAAVMDPSIQPEEINVEEILKKVEGTESRPYVLWLLAKHLFEKGGKNDLDQARKLAETLRDEYADERWSWYQTAAGGLLSKIQEELNFRIPEPRAAGPEAPPKPEAPPPAEAPKPEAPKPEAPPPAEAPPAEAPPAEAPPKPEAPKTEAPPPAEAPPAEAPKPEAPAAAPAKAGGE